MAGCQFLLLVSTKKIRLGQARKVPAGSVNEMMSFNVR